MTLIGAINITKNIQGQEKDQEVVIEDPHTSMDQAPKSIIE
jgi:hypothetical protein